MRLFTVQELFYSYKTKKPTDNLCRFLQYLLVYKRLKAKGEEKPEEELMGKRKSSPRLATTSTNRCCY